MRNGPSRTAAAGEPQLSFLIARPVWPANLRTAIGQAQFFGWLDDETRAAS